MQKIDSLNNCLNCKIANCQTNCPLHTDIKTIINLVKENKIEEAILLQYQFNSIPFICGKLCDHIRGCFGGCNNKKNKVNTFDLCYELGKLRLNLPINKKSNRKKNIVIIGGGVAGLICAELLLEEGFKVTLYDKNSSLGGVLATTMPDFRYDMNIFNKWINRLYQLGLNVHLNTEITSKSQLINYDYLIIATGANLPKKLFDDNLTVDALKLLELYKNKKLDINDKKVIVLGGGNTAYDVARVINSLGNAVSIAYRRDIKNSPAARLEIEKAIEEGVIVHECLAPKEIIKNNSTYDVIFNKTMLVDDGSSRLNFKVLDEEIKINCDLVVEAIGANSNLSFLKENFPKLINEKGYVSDIENDNVYVVGDAYLGAATFAKANLTARLCVKNILEKEKTKVLFGGSFNPPTIAHYEIIKYLSKNYDEVLLLPNGDQYSFDGKVLSSFNHRVKMLEIMCSKFNNVKILELENSDEFKGTYHTLRILNHPTFVLGADCLDKLFMWKHFSDLMKENNFILFNRNKDDLNKEILNNEHLNKYIDKFIIVDKEIPNVSSSMFRNTKNKEILTEEVYKYIIENELY